MNVWDVYFAGVCSIRLHPRAVPELNPADAYAIVRRCALVADLMLSLRENRYGSGEEFRGSYGGSDSGGKGVSESEVDDGAVGAVSGRVERQAVGVGCGVHACSEGDAAVDCGSGESSDLEVGERHPDGWRFAQLVT